MSASTLTTRGGSMQQFKAQGLQTVEHSEYRQCNIKRSCRRYHKLTWSLVHIQLLSNGPSNQPRLAPRPRNARTCGSSWPFSRASMRGARRCIRALCISRLGPDSRELSPLPCPGPGMAPGTAPPRTIPTLWTNSPCVDSAWAPSRKLRRCCSMHGRPAAGPGFDAMLSRGSPSHLDRS